jgi:ferric-dicitrate binding protein FerR (iron transport regulator)
MNEFDTADGGPDHVALSLALEELEAGTLDPVRRDALMALVARSPAAQRTYLEYFEITAMLEAEAATHAEQGTLPQMACHVPSARLFRRSLMAAAALLVLGAAVAVLIKIVHPQEPELALAAAAATRWSIDGEVRDGEGNKATVREGATLRVESGTLELRLESGAAMVVRGPAQVSFPKLTRPVVRSGWLWVDSGANSEPFEVRTPDLRIRNLGTRFGVRVPAEGPAEVHLIEGRLEVTVESLREKTFKLVPGKHGLAIPALGGPAALDLARDPFPEIAELLAAPSNYPTTVRGQNPAGFWRLDDAPGDHLQNEVKGETAGGKRSGVSMGAGGPGPADGFHGFPPENRAARLLGTPGESRLSLGSVPRHDGVLFRATFDGAGPLHRRSPKVAPDGSEWVAAPHFQGNGIAGPDYGSATLRFDPVDGVVYTLEAEIRDVTTPEGDSDWLALGFASGQSIGTESGDRFVSAPVVGRAWMLFRGSGSDSPNTALLSGDTNSESWRNWNRGVGGDIDLRIVLDTTRGAGNWTATWFARRPGGGDFIKVRDTQGLPNEAIRSAGIAVNGKARARIRDFSLRAKALTDAPATRGLADGPARMTRRSGTLSCWLRRAPGTERAEILWSAGEDPTDDAIHARLEADGTVGFFMENGRYDVLFASEETLDDGRWHHLAATWSPYTVDLYLDGRRVAGDREFRGLQQGTLPELRVGGGPQNDGAAPFTGRIDEIAVWNRTLTPIEIGQQYQSARGGTPAQARRGVGIDTPFQGIDQR